MPQRDPLTERIEEWKRRGIVALPGAEWESVADAFQEVERHPTNLAGDLVILRVGTELAALEEPSPGRRVLRFLPGGEAARRFVERGMEQYERIWDGCGCRIDYLAPDPESRTEPR